MKNTFLLLVFAALLQSCSHKIVRTGYKADRSMYSDCDLMITKDKSRADNAQILGSIRLGDKGFSANCSREDAMTILTGEGCAIGADLVIIYEEHLPSPFSTCYRCSATFYKRLAEGETESIIRKTKVTSNESTLSGRRVATVAIGFALGVAIGFVLISTLYSGA